MTNFFFIGFKHYMQINFYSNFQTFTSNNGYYRAENGNNIGTYTKMFRADLDWERFTDYIVKHFRSKDNVQILQFASSDGSEAYTQILSLLKNYDYKTAKKFLPIEAYDIDSDMYNIANSGLVNITNADKLKFSDRDIDMANYFKKIPNKKINIKNDTLENSEIYEAAPILRRNVNFHQGDMFKILQTHLDDVNTVLLCRNILAYFTDREIYNFLMTASAKLKSGSLLVTGEIDKDHVDDIIQRFDFEKIFPYVYRKV